MADSLADPYALGGCVYYAQNREDLILQSFFSDVKKGTYVDVGAFDPDYDSVTKLFYLQGWRGINIEPQASRYELFKERRPKDTNLNIGIAAKETELRLRTYTSGGLSTFSDELKEEYAQRRDADTAEYAEVTVPVRPLKDVLAEQKISHIHFLKVDVEGLEYEVLVSNDWKRFRPEVICIEANHIQRDWRPILAKADYELVFNDGLNDYYVDSKTDRKSKFNLVEDVIHIRGGGIRIDHYDLLLKLDSLAKEKSHHVEELIEELAKSQQELAKSRQKLDLSQRHLERFNGIKFTAKQLARLVGLRLKRMATEHRR